MTALGGIEAEGVQLGLMVTAVGYGLRHGVDWDHIAAITELTAPQETPRRAMGVATLYASGHAAVVLLLGAFAIVGGELLPRWLDAAMGRVVGATLVGLGAYVLWAFVRDRRNFRIRSRWLLLADALAGLRRWRERGEVVIDHDHPHDHGPGGHAHPHEHGVPTGGGAPLPEPVAVVAGHRHVHRHIGTLPADITAPGNRTALLIGLLHGIGAETPTQVILFLTAAHVAGDLTAVALLVAFLAGLVASNTAVALASSYGYLSARRSFAVYATIGIVNAVMSLVIGVVFLAGGTLPAIIAG